MKFNVLVEGQLEEPVVRQLLAKTGHGVERLFVCDGKDDFMTRWPDFVGGPGHRFGLRDLDDEATCAPAWFERVAPSIPSGARLRLAVREVEAWLLADRSRFAECFALDERDIEPYPDHLNDPKRYVVQLMGRCRKRELREQLIPRRGGGRVVGEGHTRLLGAFARERWRPLIAARRSDSLASAIRSLKGTDPR